MAFENILNRVESRPPPTSLCRVFRILTLVFGVLVINSLGVSPQHLSSKYLWLLDNGHGALTKGRTSPMLPDSTYLREWEFNRDIVRRVAKGLDKKRVAYHILVPEDNIGNFVAGRVWRVNKRKERNMMLISIHANAAGNGKQWHPANGREVFYFKGDKMGKLMATVLSKHLKEATPFRDRGIKTARFKILRDSKCPAILSEEGFFTNKEEALLLMRDDIRQRIADAHIKMILELEGR